MPPNLEPADLIALEIRLLDRTEAGYPVEMTLTPTQQVFRGQLTAKDLLPWNPTGDARADGQRLFTALFTSPELIRGWGVVQDKSKRLRLRIDAVELNALPWELLCDQIDLLAADADTPFSRYLTVSRAWGKTIDERPIRVLAVISGPIDLDAKYGLSPADVELETRALRDAIGSAAQLDFLATPATLDRLETELRKGYHILHFVGHGAFNARTQQAALYMQDATGNAQRVLDADFAGMLNRLQAPPHLVVLAACQSAQQSTSAAFTGLGPQLVQIGLPAVIAMQENVTVVTARQFAATFYQRLLAHGIIDLAMNEARGTLITNGRFDAAVPVLFMRVPDGRLWSVESLKKQTSSARSTDMADEDNKSRSGGVNISGKTKVGGGIYQADKISKIDNRTINRSGGTDIDARGGAVNITGDVVGRDKVTTTITNTGLSAADFANAFDVIYQRVATKPAEDQADIRDAVDAIKAEAKKEAVDGKQPDEKMVKLSAQALVTTAPDLLRDIADVALATLTSPAAGVMAVVRKVLEKARAS